MSTENNLISNNIDDDEDIDYDTENLRNKVNVKEVDYDIDKESKLSEIEVTDELVNEILKDKEQHIDYLNLPADYYKAVTHFRATQFYDKTKMKKNDSKQSIFYLIY